jgi:hypothetical protein
VALVESLISTVCALSPGAYNQACTKAADATSMQVGVTQEDKKYEDIIQKMALDESYKLVGQNTVYTLGGAAFVYKTYSEKKMGVDIPNAIVCDTIHADFSPSSYGLKLQWSFK